MAAFAYRAAAADGRVRTGVAIAAGEPELAARLREAGLELLRAVPARRTRLARERVPRAELIAMAVHLNMTLAAGVQLLDALGDLAESTGHAPMREVLGAVIDALREGSTLSQALARHPRVFDGVFVGLVRAGETAGDLAAVFGDLADSLRWQDELAAQVKKVTLYPTFMAVVIVAVTLFMLLYLVPQLAQFMQTLSSGPPPAATRLLLGASWLVRTHWHWLLAVPLAAAAAAPLALAIGGERLRSRVDAGLLRLPIVGPLLKKVALARFARLFGMLFGAGVPLPQALAVARGAAGNRAIQAALDDAAAAIEQGARLSDAFERTGLFPRLMLRMLRIGENTGEIDRAMRDASAVFSREVDRTIARLQTMIEPTLTVVMGLILGWLMVSVLGPVYDMLARLRF